MKTKLLSLAIFLVIINSPALLRAQEAKQECSHTEFLIKDIDAQKALTMKAEVPMSEIGAKIGELYGALFAYMQEKNIAPAGSPFAIYYSYDPTKNILFEAGVPVGETIAGNESISFKEFPVIKVVSTLYSGAYENIGPTYSELQKFMEDKKLESSGSSWEVYLTDPTQVAKPSDNKTIIYFPIK
jgi:effector-binding domain-containing protein